MLDPYAGEATTFVAAALCGRRSISFERSPENYEDAVVRATGTLTKQKIDVSPDEPAEMGAEQNG